MRTDERGETLIELLVAVVIMGIGLVAVVGGLAIGIRVSDIHRKQATAGSYVRDYAEAIDDWVTAGNFPACGDVTGYDAVTVPGFPATGYAKSVVASSCPYGSAIRQLTLEVRSSDQRATERLVVLVRKPCAVTAC